LQAYDIFFSKNNLYPLWHHDNFAHSTVLQYYMLQLFSCQSVPFGTYSSHSKSELVKKLGFVENIFMTCVSGKTVLKPRGQKRHWEL